MSVKKRRLGYQMRMLSYGLPFELHRCEPKEFEVAVVVLSQTPIYTNKKSSLILTTYPRYRLGNVSFLLYLQNMPINDTEIIPITLRTVDETVEK